ncbi:hypothetical protein A3A54_02745 [Candidatus Curtissbacteria bacterium RIFCSPLOWO2_01_FULL_39_62]|uniref:Uncharacterized protein n=2 Tax=Candidatus Curtissiibacteriota TaxID=1752717 RepID=A0A1F5GA65_9BACT|nr:MAG: hypothetical protein A2775_01545 [Candidatus Curtissbacteria bacterium RIFCSPHIGHO2_01_FULL_39_57]OGD88739.1 MAG: hypothetical protein A3D04_04245 [Candidatus Curtissbacteria bacterium RIFCSPHIGHO2_02_FULL_40_16b]OGD90283.1 MAG: hypothetical protein A3E11_01180 [Candidatus Curtissbacteria bacterium RIFCSPHIGHO2_12_FULL_38_37]OGD99177.1 MAG: hypothetical protein A3J17_00945 [Candidatus Curtissbacteria bacterium RIFCSPLOWO2_02_FULL_40_11]OGE00642.1 MAG: hypothetical protein A3A54_02745 [C
MEDFQKKQILEKLSNSQTILIAVSKKSGFDGLASGLALYLSIKKTGKNANVIASEPTVNDANNLYGVDKIGKLQGKEDLVIVINNAINTVDKVTYNLEGDELKIKVHALAGAEGISEDSISLDKSVSYPDTVIAIGFSSAGEMNNEITREQINSSTKWIMSINKNKPPEKFAQIELDDPEAATISELTTRIITDLALPFDEDISFNLYSGIKLTTQMFSPKSTAPSTLEVAKHLLQLGAGRASLASESREVNLASRHTYDKIFKQRDIKIDRISGINYQQTQSPNMDRIQRVKSPTIPSIQGPNNPLYTEEQSTIPIEDVESKEASKKAWLKPPKVYRGSKSFDRES